MMEWKSVGMTTFPSEWKNEIHVPNHQPEMRDVDQRVSPGVSHHLTGLWCHWAPEVLELRPFWTAFSHSRNTPSLQPAFRSPTSWTEQKGGMKPLAHEADFDRYQLQTAHHFNMSIFFGVYGWICWGGHVWLERCWSLQKIWKKEIGFVFSSPVCTGVVWKQGIKKSNTFPIQNLQYIFFWATPKSLEKPNVRIFAAKLQFWWLHRYTTHVWPKKRPFLKGFKPTWTAVHCGIPHFWENPGWSYRCVSQNIPLCCMLSPGSHTTVHSIRMLLTLPILDILPETTSWLVYNKRSGKVLHKSGVPGQVLIVCELVE